MSPPIAILGAGPSGLALARLLQVAKIPFVVFERDASRASAAAGGSGPLDIHADSGQIALREAGLIEQFRKFARTDASNTIADQYGKIHLHMGGDGEETDRPEIDRRDLQRILLDSIAEDRVHWDCKVERVQKEEDGTMSVHFANGKTQGGLQLVVAADGAWSKARSLITPAKPEYSGIHYLTTSLSNENPYHHVAKGLAGNGNYMAFGNKKMFITMRMGDGSYFVGVGLHLPQNWSSERSDLMENPSALRDWLLSEPFSDWSSTQKDIIRHTEGNFRPWPLYALPTEELESKWQSVPGLTLLGDAAHLTVPFEGEGVNIALTDSLTLSKLIVEHGLENLNEAVEQYEAVMLPRGIDLIKRSQAQGKFLFAEDSPKSMLRQWGLPVE
ncbi:putative monooxygenase [Lophiostoma macrostomum CBS 122681]|uniref:Putative monooxygenase n=1 Tax=Lophiostoma macrostomum CBS 122681 TaxID=1314788 RepID=A0A6A6SVM4_9PLEO|nr:putative monooxygenase [Lophiostoma macrostomum CBS 122681]